MIKRTTHAPSARTQVGVAHTLTLLRTSNETPGPGPCVPHHCLTAGTLVVPLASAEIVVLLAKDAIELVHPADIRTGIYSPYIVSKKGGGLRPILDLCIFNRALHKLPFSMLT